MKIWIITDTHFNHNILVQYGRPSNFEQVIKINLEKEVKEDDILIHLGDICIGKDKENSNWFKDNLKCKTWLIKGNHDNKSNNWYLNNGWDVVVDRMDFKFNGKRICFTHIPVSWDGYFDLNIHGHLHDTDIRRHKDDITKLNGYNKLIAIEYTNYKPVLLKTLIK